MPAEKHTAPIRRKSLERVRHLREIIPKFVIADFVSQSTDRAFKREMRRRGAPVPAHLEFENGSSQS